MSATYFLGRLCGFILFTILVFSQRDASLALVYSTCGDGLFECSGTSAFARVGVKWIPYVPKFPDSVTEVHMGHNATPAKLPDYFFSNLTNVRALDIRNNQITTLSHHAFAGMGKLQYLIVSGNKRLKVDSLREILSIPSLENVEVESCHLSPPGRDLLQNVTSSISSIAVGHNPWGDVSQLDAFCALSSLRELKCRYCNFNIIGASCQLKTLSTLDLSYNALTRLPFTCEADSRVSVFPTLKELHLRQNRIRSLVEEVCLPALTFLDLSYNIISIYPTLAFGPYNYPLLKYLSLKDQLLYLEPLTNTAAGFAYSFTNQNLEFLDLRNSHLEFAREDSVSKHAFTGCSGLKYLLLDSNSFLFVDDRRFLELFDHLHSLVGLSLKNCRLESFSTSTFANFHNITSLDLSANMLTALPDKAFDSLHRLKSLHLDHNKINTVNELTFSQHLRDNLTSLTLGFNPFHCSCDLLWFAQWYQTKQRDLFKDAETVHSYKCDNLDSKPLANFSLVDQACLLSHQSHLLVIQFCSLFMFTLILVSVLFRYRWHIRLLVYDVFRGRDHLRRQWLQENHFDYDVFVSYASDDLPWVRRHLMPKLEDELGLRLCLHERDFTPGHHIVDNIARCVDSSKKVLMVFSEGFVHSQWCQFELAYCLTHVLDYDDAVLVVCVDDVTSRQMTSSMRAVLRTMTYIQWREGDEEATASFWGRLHQGLHEILPRNEHYV